MIAATANYVIGVEFRLLEKGGDVVVVKPVLDLVVVPANRLHKPTIAQEAELMRNGRLTDPDRDGQVTDTK